MVQGALEQGESNARACTKKNARELSSEKYAQILAKLINTLSVWCSWFLPLLHDFIWINRFIRGNELVKKNVTIRWDAERGRAKSVSATVNIHQCTPSSPFSRYTRVAVSCFRCIAPASTFFGALVYVCLCVCEKMQRKKENRVTRSCVQVHQSRKLCMRQRSHSCTRSSESWGRKCTLEFGALKQIGRRKVCSLLTRQTLSSVCVCSCCEESEVTWRCHG